MATEFTSQITSTLKSSGKIANLEASIRNEIALLISPLEAPSLSKHSQIINGLILEYMKYNNMMNSASVFSRECGGAVEVVNRESSVPILYEMCLKDN